MYNLDMNMIKKKYNVQFRSISVFCYFRLEYKQLFNQIRFIFQNSIKIKSIIQNITIRY